MNIVVQVHENVLVVDSRLIAQDLDIKHKNFLETLNKYLPEIEEDWGRVAFETRLAKRPQGGSYKEKWALLSEEQATLLMTYSRNTERVRQCKRNLVKAFSRAKKIQPQSTPTNTDLLSGLEELEKLIISIRSQARAVHTCAHQPVDQLLTKSLHSLSHNQLSAIASAVHQMQALKELGTITEKLPVMSEIKTIKAQSTLTITEKKQLVSINIKLPLSQKRWLAATAQIIRQNNLQPLPAGERVYPQHLIEVAVELLQHSSVDLDSAYSIFSDLDESLANTNFKMVRSQQEWLADLAQMIRNNCGVPTLPAERVYPQHLIGVAIDLLQNVDINWSEVKNVEELRKHLNL